MKNFVLVIFSFLTATLTSCSSDGQEHVTPTPQPEIPNDKDSAEHPPVVRGFMVQSADGLAKSTLESARAWGANVIRLQLNPTYYALQNKKDIWEALPTYLDIVQEKILMAKSVGLMVIVDLHEPPMLIDGAQPDPGTNRFWNTAGLKENFIRIWQAIATKFSNSSFDDVIWGYDLYNEPQINWSTMPQQWLNMAPEIVGAIREIDKNKWIVFQPVVNIEEFNNLTPLADKKIVYSIHFYSPYRFTHQGLDQYYATGMTHSEAVSIFSGEYPGVYNSTYVSYTTLEKELRPLIAFASKNKVPVLIGEFSVISWAPTESAKRWLTDVIDLFEKNNFSWCYHAFREWQGWSLEQPEGPENFWFSYETTPAPATGETQRAKIIKDALKKNSQ